jgi:hypothetical protein
MPTVSNCMYMPTRVSTSSDCVQYSMQPNVPTTPNGWACPSLSSPCASSPEDTTIRNKHQRRNLSGHPAWCAGVLAGLWQPLLLPGSLHPAEVLASPLHTSLLHCTDPAASNQAAGCDRGQSAANTCTDTERGARISTSPGAPPPAADTAPAGRGSLPPDEPAAQCVGMQRAMSACWCALQRIGLSTADTCGVTPPAGLLPCTGVRDLLLSPLATLPTAPAAAAADTKPVPAPPNMPAVLPAKRTSPASRPCGCEPAP